MFGLPGYSNLFTVIENVRGMPFHAGIIPRLIFHFLKIYLNQFCASDYTEAFNDEKCIASLIKTPRGFAQTCISRVHNTY